MKQVKVIQEKLQDLSKEQKNFKEVESNYNKYISIMIKYKLKEKILKVIQKAIIALKLLN